MRYLEISLWKATRRHPAQTTHSLKFLLFILLLIFMLFFIMHIRLMFISQFYETNYAKIIRVDAAFFGERYIKAGAFSADFYTIRLLRVKDFPFYAVQFLARGFIWVVAKLL